MDDLIAFLNARLDEDEAAAEAAKRVQTEWYVGCDDDTVTIDALREHIGRLSPARVLREVEAKRALMAFALKNAVNIDGEWGDGHDAEEIAAGECHDHGQEALQAILAPLAAIDGGHPDYRQEWAPEPVTAVSLSG